MTNYQNIDAEQAARVAAWIGERSYSDGAILSGLAYADDNGGGTDVEVASLAMSKILYTEDQLLDGARFAVRSLDDN